MSQKYRQPGYQDQDRGDQQGRRHQKKPMREGPRSPRMPGLQEVTRCAMCGAPLPRSLDEISFSSQCPKCEADLHTCKNCTYFDPGSRFECTQSIPKRIAGKDVKNSCESFHARTVVEKITTSGSQKPSDARNAFEDLFKK